MMAAGVVFKQRYKSVNEKKTPMLNGKHLMYIATRKGAIHNKDCAFGLFGRLPFMEAAQDINNLKKAHTMITSVSGRRTIYRAILSVDDDTAKAHGLYNRAVWQKLVTDKIGVIAKEMDIDRKDFCWAASMHYAKGHPHVHIMYWDNGGKVRQEFVPDEKFEIMAEHVRAEFGREIYAEEISERREDAKDIIDEARLELMSLCKEQNVMDAFDLNHVTAVTLDDIGQRVYDLILDCPKKGSLKYAFLPEDYKNKLDDMIAEIMNIPDFRKLQQHAQRYIFFLNGHLPGRRRRGSRVFPHKTLHGRRAGRKDVVEANMGGNHLRCRRLSGQRDYFADLQLFLEGNHHDGLNNGFSD